MSAEQRVTIAAGGTAGHVVPAIAVADDLRDRGVEVTFIGADRAEQQLVPAAGYGLRQIKVSGLNRKNPIKAAVAAAQAVRAVTAARRILADLGADGVVAAGGYVAGPVGWAASRLKLPLVVTEADSHLGIANRLLASRADRVCLAFPIEGREGDHYLVTGRPVRRAVLTTDGTAARRRLGWGGEERVVLIMGGSLGARSLNEATLAAVADVSLKSGTDGRTPVRIAHICGLRDYPVLRSRLEQLNPERYQLIDFAQEQYADLLAAADLVVARSGGSVFELVAAGKPAILVPYPYATGDHQAANARWMEEAGAATVIADGDLSGELLRRQILRVLDDPERLVGMAAAAKALARPDAATLIADQVMQAIQARRRRQADGRQVDRGIT